MSDYLPLLIVFVAPTLFWAGYFYYQDRFKPEPVIKLALSYLLGLGSAYLAIGLFSLIDRLAFTEDPLGMMETNKWGFFFYTVGIIGPVEEFAKLVPFIFICRRFEEFDEKIDGIIYASMIALGFASIENARALEFLSGMEAYAHAFASPIVHCSFASIWGYAYANAYITKRAIAPITLLAFLLSSVLHGVYDFIAMHAPWAASSAVVILIIWVLGMVVMNRLQKAQKRKNEQSP